MIVVEGPDGAGKTTLIKRLCTEFPLTVAPRVVDKDTQAMVDLVKWVEEDNTKLNQGVIYDRHRLISEFVYGPIMRIHTDPGFDSLPWLTANLEAFYAKKPTIIYCMPPILQVIGNLAEDDDNITVRQRIVQIYQAYVLRAAMDISTRRAHLYDYTDPTSLRRIVGAVNREEVFYG